VVKGARRCFPGRGSLVLALISRRSPFPSTAYCKNPDCHPPFFSPGRPLHLLPTALNTTAAMPLDPKDEPFPTRQLIIIGALPSARCRLP
jgi:hypothetical protein